MLDASTGFYSTRRAGGSPVEMGPPLNQYTLWEVSEICMDMLLLCPDNDSKFTFVKKSQRRDAPA